MSLFTITNEYEEPLEAAHARIDDDRYDLVECAAAGQPTLDLSNQLLGCGIDKLGEIGDVVNGIGL